MTFLRDGIFKHIGTDEAVIAEDWRKQEIETGKPPHAMHWRRPLSLPEVNRMAPTAEVRERRGRP